MKLSWKEVSIFPFPIQLVNFLSIYITCKLKSIVSLILPTSLTLILFFIPSQGLVIDQIRGSLGESKTRFIYVGDGMGDYCPTLKLEGGDFVMPRKNYPLWNKICSDPKLVHAEVHDWSSGEEFENILLNLVNKLAT